MLVCVNSASLSSAGQMFAGVVIIIPYKDAGEEGVIKLVMMSPHVIWINLPSQRK